jgi:hypothetical protein
LEDKIVKNYLYVSKLEAQMVTSTPSENLSLQLYKAQNKNFNFGITKTLILHTRLIFFTGGYLTKIRSKKNIFHENPVEVRSFDGMYVLFTRFKPSKIYKTMPICSQSFYWIYLSYIKKLECFGFFAMANGIPRLKNIVSFFRPILSLSLSSLCE